MFPYDPQRKLTRLKANSRLSRSSPWLQLAFLLLACVLTSACGAAVSQKKVSPRPTGTSRMVTPRAEETPQASATPAHLSVLLPAYWDDTSSNWARLIKTHPQGTIAIINLNDGPVDSYSPTLAQDITSAQKSGIKVIGYVWTGQADPAANAPNGQSEATVKYNIDLWYKYYKLDGIHLDDALFTQERLPYFRDLYTYIKQKGGANALVYINGAAIPPAGYAQVADVMKIYEGTLDPMPNKGYEGYGGNYIQGHQSDVHGWMSQPANATKFAVTVSNVHTASQMREVIQTSIQAHVHYVYMVPTDQEYMDLPPYWEELVALLNSTVVSANS